MSAPDTRRARRHVPDTSRAAEKRALPRSVILRADIVAKLEWAQKSIPESFGLTADEIHELLCVDAIERSDVRRLMEVRRRVSDLVHTYKLLHDTGRRRENAEGNPQIVWALIPNHDTRLAWEGQR